MNTSALAPNCVPTASLLLMALAFSGLSGCIASAPRSSSLASAGQTSVGADEQLQRCQRPLGTLTVDDGRRSTWWGGFVQTSKITTIEPLVRTLVQQSNCFVLTSVGNLDRSAVLDAVANRQTKDGVRPGSNLHGGQVVATDYFMTPSIMFSEGEKTNVNLTGVLGKVFGNPVRAFKQDSSVSVVLSIDDIRSRVQVASGLGNGTATSWGTGLTGTLSTDGGGPLAAYSQTPAGKATVAAFAEAYNAMVVSLRNYRPQNVDGGLGTGGRLKVGS
ncbi:hypothetical protein HLB44_29885 [Aquincola sp. S2]|uniref:Peptidoglycan-binding protein n=1 Tax=Pseudaquabacterium terrae TaxID=2732868 RepID=A0ABX2ERP4_9BURK|nr:hypothetical protein [Aquabacterium terrae]NRF71212.1 hypothetical protein [Aquabacterium terrae]